MAASEEEAYPPLMLSILQAGAASSKAGPYLIPIPHLKAGPIPTTQAGAASSKAYARVWQRTNRNVLVDSKPARRRDVLLQVSLERGKAYCIVPSCTTKQVAWLGLGLGLGLGFGLGLGLGLGLG